jgi:hypothetical protein|nr:MAG TPA: hypothetical protein [Caudoviricetes sp.]
MRLSKVLLVAGAGVLVYKVLSRVKIVKVDFPEELPREFALATEIIGEVYGEELAKGFEKVMKDNESKTKMSINEKAVELARERPISIQEANHEVASEVRGITDKAKKLIEEYHENYREVTV